MNHFSELYQQWSSHTIVCFQLPTTWNVLLCLPFLCVMNNSPTPGTTKLLRRPNHFTISLSKFSIRFISPFISWLLQIAFTLFLFTPPRPFKNICLDSHSDFIVLDDFWITLERLSSWTNGFNFCLEVTVIVFLIFPLLVQISWLLLPILQFALEELHVL